jgi:NAD(P)-dependent dehydrogenase (short-subunit alcohol dehydrogenase family)
MRLLCEGRVAVVTGAGRGIGRSEALGLAAAGALVVVNDLGGRSDGTGSSGEPAHEVVEEIRAAGGEAVANGDDISDWEGAERLITLALTTYGRLDVLVNNAGVLRDRMLVNMTMEDWDQVMRVHLRGAFCPTRHAAEYWRNQSKAGAAVDARVINTSSSSGIYGNPGQTNYGTAKAGIAAFTIIASQELSRYGVTVNAVAPAAATRLTAGLGAVDELSPERRDALEPRWPAAVVTWLASAESAGVTGRVIESSGLRLTMAEGWRRGPSGEPSDDPEVVGAVIAKLAAESPAPEGILGI